MTYHQLTDGERYTISTLRIARYSVTDISKVLGRHRSTIYREVSRNSTTRDAGERWTYCPSKARSGAMESCAEAAEADAIPTSNTLGWTTCLGSN